VSPAEEQEQFLLEAEDLAQQLTALQREVQAGSRSLTRVSSVVHALDDLVALAAAAETQDPKLEQLIAEIADIRAQHPKANVLVYTEYTDSLEAVVQALQHAGMGPVLKMCGDDPDSIRGTVTDRFCTHDGLVLVSTDAAAEGLNLHAHCYHLLHLELPFNPNRLEQRNGRIDRYGQAHDPVVRYLFLRGTFEERILLRLIAKYERQRARLTFVPNTLGLTASTEVAAERLLRGLMDEDMHLFQEESTPLDFVQAAEDMGMDEATQELLEEVDRSLRGFEQAARIHTWLGDLGVNADAGLLAEADRARLLGDRSGRVDLARFVCDAVLLDGGQVVGSLQDDVFEVRLPGPWSFGLDELPGYDAVSRILRLTTNMEVTRDAHDRSVGFLGRAHPLVRRALDRVRHLSFGGMAQVGQDPWASAVAADVSVPTLLFTFLGRITSRAGRELERVLAVKATPQETPAFYETADRWAHLADPRCAVRTANVFKHYFEDWFAHASLQAQRFAETGFRPSAEAFVHQRQDDLNHERDRQHEWLQQRTREIVEDPGPPSIQTGLFDLLVPGEPSPSERPLWATLADPVERLAMHHRYSRVPLRDDNPERKVEMTHVAIVDLAGRRVQERRAITIDDLVAAETPLPQAIDLLKSRGFCFVLVHDAIRKILTRSDLNKLPVRVYLGTLLAHVEGMLADTIDTAFPNEAWFPGLAAARQP